MFGYVLPRRDRLSEEAQARYHAAYCGLCRALKLEYGFAARFLVNYDMTFLYFLLREGDPACPGRCFCPARPWCRKACLPEDGYERLRSAVKSGYTRVLPDGKLTKYYGDKYSKWAELYPKIKE